MPEQLFKLTPDRDLVSYFLMPSAIAALSSASANGFTLSGRWRQQFDWAVVEWNRDNVFEHPALRNLPDGDLSGLVLSYEEERTNCIPIESNLFPTVAWNRLRLWVPNDAGTEDIYYVDIGESATPLGTTQPAAATMTVAAVVAGKRIGLAFLEEHYYVDMTSSDTTTTIATNLAATISYFSKNFSAKSNGPNIVVTWNSAIKSPNLNGANGNRLSMYGFTEAAQTVWAAPSAVFSAGSFAARYRIQFDFGNLWAYTDTTTHDTAKRVLVPTKNVRKLRWTWSADMQPAGYNQADFTVNVSNWTVTGTNRIYYVAGPGSRRIEDSDSSVTYSDGWTVETGNYSASKVHYTTTSGSTCSLTYQEGASHQVYLGLRRTASAPVVNILIDGVTSIQANMQLSGEDVLIRYPLGAFAPGTHTVQLTTQGDSRFDFDFLEIAYPSDTLPDFPPQTQLSLATDWDTYHSQSLPAERTAWLIYKLGFHARVNHYVGALWFYEMVRTGTKYASLTVTFDLAAGDSSPLAKFYLAAVVGDLAYANLRTAVTHSILPDDTSATVALAIAAAINIGTNLVWASTNGAQLIVTARGMGKAGNGIGFAADPETSFGRLSVSATSNELSGGIDGDPFELIAGDGGLNDTFINNSGLWRTDLTASPRINRAARDWHQAFFKALNAYGLDAVAAFSTELANGDTSRATGIAQRYSNGQACVLNTPAIQTNFSPTALDYWKQVYLDMAQLQVAGGLKPSLQSGEVQWWYFPNVAGASMPFYDEYTRQQFLSKYLVPMETIWNNLADPALYPNEVAFLPTLIGAYTEALRTTLQSHYPGCRYEVLYPTDVNDTPLNQLINYPAEWNPANLTCLKTESFGFTGSYNLVNCTRSILTSAAKGFPNSQRAHLVGVGDAWSAWLKEVDIAQSHGLESIVLFALDQYCLVGYPPPPFVKTIDSGRQG